MARTFVAKQSYYFKASPKKVFQAMTDPKVLSKWFLSRAKLDPKKNGAYTFEWMGGYHMTGKVKRFEVNKAVTFSWHDKMSNGKMVQTTATFQITRQGRGTILRLRHSGFKDPEHFADCSSRWGYYLTNMKSVIDRGADLRSKYDW